MIKFIRRIVGSLMIFLAANIPLLHKTGVSTAWCVLLGIVFLILNIAPASDYKWMPNRRHRICAGGCELLIYFLISTAVSIVYMVSMIPGVFPGHVLFSEHKSIWFINLFCIILMENIVFWNGIIRVYCTSFQIGMKWRIIGAVCGMLPIVHLFVLYRIIRIAYDESIFESEKLLFIEEHKTDELCKTKYPLLLVHGVFFRDFKYFNYWGRIPKMLEENGAVIYYGNHQSAASVVDSAAELAERIKTIMEEIGCEKVNIIAHSKGGLDSRYMISLLGMDQYVASLTTINTPHRGCVFADYLLGKMPQAMKDKLADGYNVALMKLGDENPDFIAAVTDLTASACEVFNQKVFDKPGVYYQSVGSKLNVASDGRFPLNFSHHLVQYFDGPNDGLVAESSFPWGEEFTFLTTNGKRGISHGDMIDLNRENIKEFDVRGFYVELVNRLKERGF